MTRSNRVKGSIYGFQAALKNKGEARKYPNFTGTSNPYEQRLIVVLSWVQSYSDSGALCDLEINGCRHS